MLVFKHIHCVTGEIPVLNKNYPSIKQGFSQHLGGKVGIIGFITAWSKDLPREPSISTSIHLNLWTKDSRLSNFADDTQSCIIKPTEEELRRTTIQESEAVVGYFSANNLVNNKDKAALLYNNRRKADTLRIFYKNIKNFWASMFLIFWENQPENVLKI